MIPCTFCEIVAGRLPCWKVYEDDSTLAFFDKNGITAYHTLVIPKRHAADIFTVPDEDLRAVGTAIRRICRTYRDQLGIEALQVISSNGAAAQQDTFHMHFHIVPRFKNDGNDVKWLPDPALPSRFDELLSHLHQHTD